MTQTTGPELQAFTAFYRENLGRIHAYCLRRLVAADAQDATAEVFTVVWRRWDDRPSDLELVPWVYGIARNVVANGNRSTRRQERLTRKLIGSGRLVEHGPEADVVITSEHEQVLRAISKLSEADQETIRLVEWEGLNRDEVAEVFGVSRAAIDQRMSRAYRRLGRLLDGSGRTRSIVGMRLGVHR